MSTVFARLPRRQVVAAAVLVALLVGGLLTTSDDRAEAVDGPVDVVYIAQGEVFPDALGGAVIAAMNNAPLLLVSGTNFADTIPGDTAAELTRLEPARIVVLGGPDAVSDTVLTALRTFATDDDADEVTRLAGSDRFGTAADIAQALPDLVKDADLLDGRDDYFNPDNDGDGSGLDADLLDGRDDYFNPDNDGDGSGLDADLLDGLDSSAFAPTEVADPFLVQLNLGTFVEVAQNGPLTVAAFCEDSGDGTPVMAVKVATSVDPAYNEDTSGSFAPADGFIDIGDTREPGPGEYANDIDEGTAIAQQDGTLYVVSVDGETKGHGEDIFGQTCTMNGVVNSYSAPAGIASGAQAIP